MADQESGFEYRGLFYPWHVTSKGADLILIDRVTGMNVKDFFELIEDQYDMSRAPVTLALMATSMRNRHPERSVERIYRTVMDLDIQEDVEFVGVEEGEEEPEDDESPPAGGGDSDLSGSSPQTSNGSVELPSTRSPVTPDSSGSPGSPTGSESSAQT